jgi:tetratricopeptide (TPR) repeat protein
LYAKRGDYVRYWFYNEEALRIDLRIGERRFACMSIHSFAKVLLILRQFDHAEKLTRKAARLGQKLKLTDYLIYIYKTLTEILIEREKLAEAAECYAESFALARTFGNNLLLGDDGRFDLALLGIRLRFLQGQLDTAGAMAEFETLLPQVEELERRAKVHYEVWRIDATREAHCAKATELYHQLYTESPQAIYRRRYTELTSEALPEPAPLEDVLGLIPAEPFDLAILLARLDQMVRQTDAWFM